MAEIRFVPDDASSMDAMFAAMSECQALHPDTDDSEEEGMYDDAEEEEEEGLPGGNGVDEHMDADWERWNCSSYTGLYWTSLCYTLLYNMYSTFVYETVFCC